MERVRGYSGHRNTSNSLETFANVDIVGQPKPAIIATLNKHILLKAVDQLSSCVVDSDVC